MRSDKGSIKEEAMTMIMLVPFFFNLEHHRVVLAVICGVSGVWWRDQFSMCGGDQGVIVLVINGIHPSSYKLYYNIWIHNLCSTHSASRTLLEHLPTP